MNCIEVSACTYIPVAIVEKEEDLFNAARFRDLEDVIAPNGILVLPGKKAIIGREGNSIKLEGLQILKSLNNKKYNDYAHYLCGEKIDKEGSVNFLF